VRQVLGRRVKGARSPSLVDCDIHTSQPRIIHAYVRHQAAACIGNGKVVGNIHLGRFAFSGGNDSPRIGEVQGRSGSGHEKLLRWN
jgi:hypothetical protein